MAKRPVIIAVGLVLVAVGAGGCLVWRSEVAGPHRWRRARDRDPRGAQGGRQLTSIEVRKGDQARAGDVVAELSALELAAAVAQARAALDAAAANRDHVYAGVRAEEIASLAAAIAKAKANLELCPKAKSSAKR